jgi:hypothetical protein
MANCSIPNSSPANGRTLTRSSRLSKKLNKRASFQCPLVTRCASHFEKRRHAAALQSALRARKLRRWMFDVGCSTFSSFWRVKGAWWPSRSSKPSSSCKWRGRFDSYPLRHIIFEPRLPIFDCQGASRIILSTANRNSKIENPPKGGDLDVARADS